jgi:hypothetical protein
MFYNENTLQIENCKLKKANWFPLLSGEILSLDKARVREGLSP